MEQGNVLRHRLNFGYYETRVSIPLEQGNVLRQNGELRLISLPFVSIPLEQGNVLRHYEMRENGLVLISLNPFGTGQCLTTYVIKFNNINPMSQSLWNRAMSYDA